MDVVLSLTYKISENLIINRLGFCAKLLSEPDAAGHAANVLRRVTELGANFISTADSYGSFRNEELIAKALAPYVHNLLISTKGGLVRESGDTWRPNGRPEYLRDAVEGSLRRLQLDSISHYQLHAPDPDIPFEDSVGELARLREEGKIEHIGLCNVSLDQIRAAQRIVPIVSIQNRYSLNDRSSEPILRLCEEEGLAFMPWHPLDRRMPASQDAELKQIAGGLQATPDQILLAWLLHRSPAIVAMPSTKSLQRLEDYSRAADIHLSEENMAEIETRFRPAEDQATTGV